METMRFNVGRVKTSNVTRRVETVCAVLAAGRSGRSEDKRRSLSPKVLVLGLMMFTSSGELGVVGE